MSISKLVNNDNGFSKENKKTNTLSKTKTTQTIITIMKQLINVLLLKQLHLFLFPYVSPYSIYTIVVKFYHITYIQTYTFSFTSFVFWLWHLRVIFCETIYYLLGCDLVYGENFKGFLCFPTWYIAFTMSKSMTKNTTTMIKNQVSSASRNSLWLLYIYSVRKLWNISRAHH